TTAPAIHMVHVAGSHREVGAQIGSACADVLREAVEFDAEIPAGRTRAYTTPVRSRYRAVTAEAHPWYLDEVEGAAEAAEVDPLALFACATEEIWHEPRTHALKGRCSDLVAVPPATAGGRVLVAHNNDMHRKYQEQLVATEWEIPSEPAERGTWGATNHYVGEGMLGYEGGPEYAEHSAVRYRRASELLRAEEPGTVTADRLRTMLSDHENPPDALCRHPERWGGDTA